MNKQYNIDIYLKLASAANFFLCSSFKNLNNAMNEELKTAMLLDEIAKTDILEKDKKNLLETKLPTNPVDILQSKDQFSISGDLMNKFLLAGKKADMRAELETIKFKRSYAVNSIEQLGHFNNFGFFLETIINRHFLFLLHSKKIEKTQYKRISKLKILDRIKYLSKGEQKKSKMSLNKIANLFNLRNKTVHYTPNNAIDLSIRISELYQIWNQSIELLEKLEVVQQFEETKFSIKLQEKNADFQNNWVLNTMDYKLIGSSQRNCLGLYEQIDYCKTLFPKLAPVSSKLSILIEGGQVQMELI